MSTLSGPGPEQLLATRGPRVGKSLPAATQQLVHRLQVYQVKLELQNEGLRRAQETIAKARDRYADLDDFAPVVLNFYVRRKRAGRRG